MSKPKKTTIKDVAAAAGVSATTVSDALSGKGRLPYATRLKVKAVAAELRYRPSAIARSLQCEGLGLVGISIAPVGPQEAITNVSYWAAIVTHASQSILQNGHAPVLLPHNVDLLSQMRVPLDGAIVVDPFETDPVVAYFEGRGIHCLTIGRDLGRPDILWVDDDTVAGVLVLLSRTLATGSRLALISVGPTKSYVADAISAARAWADQNSGSVTFIHAPTLERSSVWDAVERALEAGATAILAQNDRLAMLAHDALIARGVRIPEQVRLLSAADSVELEDDALGISAARQHPRLLAEMAADMLDASIRGTAKIENARIPMETAFRRTAPQLTPKR